MNQVQVTGRLVRDPEERETPDGRKVCTVRLAVEDMGRNHEAGYIDVTQFGAAGEAAARTLSKGWLVAASGRLEYREWRDRESGAARSALAIVGRIEFLAAPQRNGNGSGSASGRRSERREQAAA
jgi:single-strand DNA-binding protein